MKRLSSGVLLLATICFTAIVANKSRQTNRSAQSNPIPSTKKVHEGIPRNVSSLAESAKQTVRTTVKSNKSEADDNITFNFTSPQGDVLIGKVNTKGDVFISSARSMSSNEIIMASQSLFSEMIAGKEIHKTRMQKPPTGERSDDEILAQKLTGIKGLPMLDEVPTKVTMNRKPHRGGYKKPFPRFYYMTEEERRRHYGFLDPNTSETTEQTADKEATESPA